MIAIDGAHLPRPRVRQNQIARRLALKHLAFRIDDRLTLDVGADLANLVSFSNPAGIIFGPMAGVGAEYKLDKDLAVTFRSRFGPEFAVVNGGSAGELAFQTLLGFAYNMR